VAPERPGVVARLLDAVLVPILAIVTALLIGGAILWGAGPRFDGPYLGLGFVAEAYLSLLDGAFGSRPALIDTALRSVPYVFSGLAVMLAFRGGLFNIGAEGQLTVGALAAAWAGFGLDLPPVIHLVVVLAAGCLAGGVWGGVAGLLKARTGAHEVITTIMLNYIAGQLASYLLNGPLRDRSPLNVIAQTPKIAEGARLPDVVAGLHSGVLLTVVVAIIVWFVVWKTTTGFELRMVGSNPDAAAYAGVNVVRRMTWALGVSGLLAGLAGAVQVAGVNYRSTLGFNIGYGFDSIAIALLGRNTVSGVLMSSILFAALRTGATKLQFRTQVSADIISVIQALVLLLVAAEQIVRWLYRMRAPAIIVQATEDDAVPVSPSPQGGGTA
jgi:simple sugar transport system permease protein